MLMVQKSARAHSIKSRVVPKSAVARERVKAELCCCVSVTYHAVLIKKQYLCSHLSYYNIPFVMRFVPVSVRVGFLFTVH